jgi:hypothetical protein
MKKFSKKFKNGASNEEALQARNWTVDQFSEMVKDPTVLFIDLRKAGSYRGGADANGISQTYHQGHFRLALNLNTSEIQTVEQLEEEIEMGNNSAVGPIKEAIYLAIVSNFHILLYNQDGMDLHILELFIHSSITWQGERFNITNEYVHWLDGMIDDFNQFRNNKKNTISNIRTFHCYFKMTQGVMVHLWRNHQQENYVLIRKH